MGLVHIDAHCDSKDEYSVSKLYHGGPFRNASVDGDLDPERTIHIGIRGRAEAKWAFSYDSGIRIFNTEEFHTMGVAAEVEESHKVCGDGPIYHCLDVDRRAAIYAGGTGT